MNDIPELTEEEFAQATARFVRFREEVAALANVAQEIMPPAATVLSALEGALLTGDVSYLLELDKLCRAWALHTIGRLEKTRLSNRK